MRYHVTLDPEPKPLEVDVVELPSGKLEVHIDGKLADVDVVSLSGTLSVRIDGRMVDLTTEGVPPDIGVIASGHRTYVRVVSERQRAADLAKKGGGGGGDKVLKSPMPGRVVKLLVKAGDDVTPGQPLIVVEAMKMENELKAKVAGKVAEIFVEAGTAVENNAKLLSFA